MTQPVPVLRGSADECAARIHLAGNPLVVCHVDPDGDAIGSLLGVGWFLQAMGVEHRLACGSPELSRMRFLPHSRPLTASAGTGHDLIIAVDCNSLDRLGPIASDVNVAGVPIVNIDHHVTNTFFGAANWVDSQAAATAEMIYQLGAPLGVSLSPEAANCLLTGIITDTWAFRTPNTTSRTMEVAMQTMAAGGRLAEIVAQTIESRTFAGLRLWARVIDRAELNDGVVWAQITMEDFKEVGTSREGQNGLVNFLLSAREAHAAVVLTETAKQLVDVSMRSNPGVDVSTTAVRLGGGGHPQAAGVTLPMTLAEARSRVEEALLQSLSQQNASEMAKTTSQ